MIDIYQISLNGGAYDARGKSLDFIYKQTGCRPLRNWRDPLLDRPMLIGEVGCAISHLRIWEKIAASGRNGIILEEDAVYDSIDIERVDNVLQSHDSAWLGYRENSMGYWYNAHAYAITPETAQYLLSQGFHDSIVPVDEFLPFALTGGKYGAYRGGSVEEKDNFFFEPPIVKQVERNQRESTIEGTEQVPDTQIHLITVATDPSKCVMLSETAKKFQWPLTVLGDDLDWQDDMKTAGGFPKIELVRKFVSEVTPDTIVMFMDGYDTFINDTMDTVLERYKGFNADIVIGAERLLWPEWEYGSDYPESHTPYRYLNSGQYIGTAGAINKFLEKGNIEQELDDQAFFHERFLEGNINVTLDRECYIFQNHEPAINRVGDQLFNPITSCYPCTYHGNGGDYEKGVLNKVYSMFNGEQEDSSDVSLPFVMKMDYEVVAPEMIVTKLFSESECQRIIEMAEKISTWEPMEGDKFPAQEIRVQEMGMWNFIERIWNEKLGRLAEEYWQPMLHYGLRDAFAMRYTMDTQTSLGLHTDASHVTGSVKLNDDYEGADLVFPRQNFSAKDIPVGHCLLFPSQVTHGHKVEELQSGVKYSLTMWTSRFKGDVN